MQLSEAADIWIDYHKNHSKKDTLRSYQAVIEPFCREFGERTISQIVPDEILSFLNRLTDGNNPCIKRVRYSQLSWQVCKNPDDRIFPISYEAARMIVLKAGKLVGIHLRSHDLLRHSATFASRSGVPIEIVSKLILRHSNLSATQRYLGTINDVEAIRWIDNIYG